MFHNSRVEKLAQINCSGLKLHELWVRVQSAEALRNLNVGVQGHNVNFFGLRRPTQNHEVTLSMKT